MKARELSKILGNPGYTISNHKKYIAVGSAYVHDLLSVDKETLEIKYALDTFKKGKAAIDNKKLEFIWDQLQRLIDTGKIQDIIDGKDEIENPLPVFTVENGVLVESVTDKYGWPNTDDNGIMMYENTHFPTKLQALEEGIKDFKSGEKLLIRRIDDTKKELEKLQDLLAREVEIIINLEAQKEEILKSNR